MKKRNFIILITSIVLMLFGLSACSEDLEESRPELDFEEMISVEYDGMNGNGTLRIVENQEIYEDKDLLEELYPENSTKKAKEKLAELMESVEYSASKENDLSNGDEVTITVSYDKGAFDEEQIIPSNEEFTITVEGLMDGETIDVFEGLAVSFSGLSGKGVAHVDTGVCNEFAKNYVTYYCSESGTLTNGDVITIRAEYDTSIADEQLLIIDTDTKEYTVTDLKEPVVIDPFEKLELTFTGASPYVNVAMDSSKCGDMVNEYIRFVVHEGYLRNGDTFTITAVYDQYDAEQVGFIVKEDTKTYTVEGQPEYVTSLEGMDLTALHEEMDDKLAVITATNEGSYRFAGVRLNGPSGYYSNGSFKEITYEKYKQSYLLSVKSSYEKDFIDNEKNYNRYIMIYEYLIADGGTGTEVFVIVYADNILKNEDGTAKWKLELGATGYGNYDSLINDFVTSQREYYNVSEITETVEE